MQTRASLLKMHQLGSALRVETLPCLPSGGSRMPLDAAFRTQRLCRHMLNVVATFA